MDNYINQKIEPVCRFGPGGDYISFWPGQADEPSGFLATRFGKAVHSVNEVLYAFVGCGAELNPSDIADGQIHEQIVQRKGKTEYGFGHDTDRQAYASSITTVKGDSAVSEEPMLFTDNRRIIFPVGHKSKHRIRASRRAAKKRVAFGLPSQGSLFESDFAAQELLDHFTAGKAKRSSSIQSQIPLVGRVAAGLPIEAVENIDSLSLGSCFGTSDDIFALQVSGDSMINDGINDGDYVVCRKTATAHDGQLVVAIVDNENATVKRFYKEQNRIRLQPANDDYQPIYSDNCRIEAVVIGLVRKLS